MRLNIGVIELLKYLIYLLPLSLLTGSFLPDLIVSSSVVIFLIYTILSKEYINFFIEKKIIYFYFFYLLLLISSLLSDQIILSMEASLPFIRLGFFCLVIKAIHQSDPKFFANYRYWILIPLLILLLSGLIEFIKQRFFS